MTFFDKLKAHIGGLIRIKTELYWYASSDWDNDQGRICLVLDAATSATPDAWPQPRPDHPATTGLLPAAAPVQFRSAFAQLMIDGEPCWVWLNDGDVEVISDGSQKIF